MPAANPTPDPEPDTEQEPEADAEAAPLHPLEAIKQKQANRQPPPGQRGFAAHARQGGDVKRSYNRHR